MTLLDEWFVTLDINNDIGINIDFGESFLYAVGATLMVTPCHNGISTKFNYRIKNALVVCCHVCMGQYRCNLFVNSLNNWFSTENCQWFARKTGRGVSGGNDCNKLCHNLVFYRCKGSDFFYVGKRPRGFPMDFFHSKRIKHNLCIFRPAHFRRISGVLRALEKAGLGHIPVISINANGMETNEGFRFTLPMLIGAAQAIVFGDLLMRCLYRVRPYEIEAGSANRLAETWSRKIIDHLVNGTGRYGDICQQLVDDFDHLPIHEDMKKPRVGIVGEILVKYMPVANNHLVDLLEEEGAEAVVPDLMDFMNYSVYNGKFKHEYLGKGWTSEASAVLGVKGIRALRRPALKALEKSKRFEPPMHIEQIAELSDPFLSQGNQYGEGWFLAGEMVELITSGTPNVICIQPFACLPNHVVGKGVIKVLKKAYPQANIAAVDYDPGASEVNQLNRIKLMLSAAKQNL